MHRNGKLLSPGGQFENYSELHRRFQKVLAKSVRDRLRDLRTDGGTDGGTK